MNTSIRATSLTLRELVFQKLRDDLNLSSFFDPGVGGPMVVSLLAPEELETNSHEGLCLWLYRIERDEQTLNQPRRCVKDRFIERPLPLKLHYLAVCVIDTKNRVDGPELEHNILGAVMQTFHDHATLRGADLQGDLGGSSLEIHVRLETLDLDQTSRMWEALNHAYQLCISYEVAVVPIDSALQPINAPRVDVVMPTYGVASPTGDTP
jgi:uncharacterized protein DUF4255